VLELHDGELRARCLCIASDGFGRVALLLLVPSGRALHAGSDARIDHLGEGTRHVWLQPPNDLESRRSFARYLGDPHTPPQWPVYRRP
jgi:hypothetical protein